MRIVLVGQMVAEKEAIVVWVGLLLDTGPPLLVTSLPP